MTNGWICLWVTGLFEIAQAIGLKYAEGFTRPTPSAFTVVALALGIGLLAKAGLVR